ncbi:MAG: ABC transporter ATP-binding protein/permease, partial [Coriobacteriales bacterium]|nr:ABC transporter ATP-binding protein/permease [Coriobacteriales bacterium]
NEFAAILGPSGSGKTTLLNIVGGLDKADSGELVIDGVSTKQYKDRDWDTYRNNRIGFVFQSYNLINHQTVLANVELALTLSGVPKSERQRRAKQVLEEVGLGEHINKKPSQLSGGQMQRVAIARALVNDPEIMLADEPTGALDSKTSLQIMELLKRIADQRLVIMVTHNPSLAETYANRTINLSDGRVVSDSNPYQPSINLSDLAKTVRRTSMSFFTSLSRSFSNLMTKKGRTIMTAFAGSIGIIGIAAILALANGVNAYIKNVEESTLSQYPLQITRTGMDLTALMMTGSSQADEGDDSSGDSGVHISSSGEGELREINLLASIFQSVTTNDLKSLKVFLDDANNEVWEYVNAIEYSYDLTPQIYLGDTSKGVYQANPGRLMSLMDPTASSMGSTSSAFSLGMNMSLFNPLPTNMALVEDQYDIKAGRWPEAYNECVLVLVTGNMTSDYVMYTLGLKDPAEMDKMIDDFINQHDVYIPTSQKVINYQDILDVDLRLVLSTEYYTFDSTYQIYVDHREDEAFLKDLVGRSEHLYLVGIVCSSDDSSLDALSPGINYSPELNTYLMGKSNESKLVRDQLARPGIDVLSGKTFEEANNDRGSDFDMGKMLTIDEEALSGAFSFDADAFGDLDLSGMMDAGALADSLPEFPSLDLSGMFSGLEASDLPLAGLADFAITVLGDYLTDRSDVIGVEADQLLADFTAYLQSPEGTAALSAGLLLSIDMQGFSGLTADIVSEFMIYCTDQNIVDADQMLLAFPGWLADYWAINNVNEQIDSFIDDDILINVVVYVITDFMATQGITLEGLIEDIGTDFSEWMSDPTIAARISADFAVKVNLEPLITKLSSGFGGYLQSAMETFMWQFMQALTLQLTNGMTQAMGQLSGVLSEAMGFDSDAFASAFQFNMTQEELGQLMLSMLGRQLKSYESNLKLLGYADPAVPSGISIYPRDFDCKQSVLDILDAYNKDMEDSGQDDKVIVYTDYVGALMSSVTDIIDMISMVLVAFVAISLIVSSIMIGIVTYISVLERKKEIGILRSIGASKRDIGNVFNAETLLIGLTAGVIGIALTALGCIPANIIVEASLGVRNIAQLPLTPSIILIGISCLLSFVAGLIPSAAASRRDPVEALRSE